MGGSGLFMVPSGLLLDSSFVPVDSYLFLLES